MPSGRPVHRGVGRWRDRGRQRGGGDGQLPGSPDPGFASDLDDSVFQIHSRDYRNPSQLQPGDAVVVGAGNSGAEIALDIQADHRVWLSGGHPGHIPFDIEGFMGRKLLVRLVLRGVFHRVLSVKTPMGRRFRAKKMGRGRALVRTKPRDLEAAGIERVPRVEGVEGGKPRLADGRTLEVANVVWCTGFTPGFTWIDIEGFDGGMPPHRLGMAEGTPGLYFVGLEFLSAASSEQVHGVGRDADRVADAVATRRVRQPA